MDIKNKKGNKSQTSKTCARSKVQDLGRPERVDGVLLLFKIFLADGKSRFLIPVGFQWTYQQQKKGEVVKISF